MFIKPATLIVTLVSLIGSPSFASSYYQSSILTEGSSRDWHWQLSDNFSAAMTEEKTKTYTWNNFGLMCGDGIGGCNFTLYRRNSPCPKASSHSLVFRFPTTRFAVDSICVDSTDNASLVILPSEDNEGFINFASLVREETSVTVIYNADLKQISTSQFSLMGSATAIKTASTTYTAGYIARVAKQANDQLLSELRAEFPEHEF